MPSFRNWLCNSLSNKEKKSFSLLDAIFCLHAFSIFFIHPMYERKNLPVAALSVCSLNLKPLDMKFQTFYFKNFMKIISKFLIEGNFCSTSRSLLKIKQNKKKNTEWWKEEGERVQTYKVRFKMVKEEANWKLINTNVPLTIHANKYIANYTERMFISFFIFLAFSS